MINAQQVIDIALTTAAKLGRAAETIVVVADRSAASLRWANNSMTTNGVSTARQTTAISVARHGDTARVGSVTTADVEPFAIDDLAAASPSAAVGAPEARRAPPTRRGTPTSGD